MIAESQMFEQTSLCKDRKQLCQIHIKRETKKKQTNWSTALGKKTEDRYFKFVHFHFYIIIKFSS